MLVVPGWPLTAQKSLPPWLLRAGGAIPVFDLDSANDRYFFRRSLWPDHDALLTAIGGTFTRASTATYFDVNGVMQTAPSGTLRVNDHDPATGAALGMLLEGARTNYIFPSEALDDVAWIKRNGTSVTPNDAVAPDGTTTADLVENLTGIFGNDLYKVGGATVGNTVRYEPSFWIKRVTTSGTLTTSHPSGAANGQWGVDLSALSNSWERITRNHAAVTVTTEFTGDGSSNNNLQFYRSAGASALSFHLWGIQGEIGSFSSSYIKTTTSTVTRAADSLVIGPTGGVPFTGWTAAEGTLVAWGSYPDAPASGQTRLFAFVGAGGVANWSIGNEPALGGFGYIVYDGAYQAFSNRGNPTAGQSLKIANAIKANDFAVSLNGEAAVTDASGTIPDLANKSLYIGDNNAGSGAAFAHIARLTYFDFRDPNADLARLTT